MPVAGAWASEHRCPLPVAPFLQKIQALGGDLEWSVPSFLVSEADSVLRSRSHCRLRQLQGSLGPESILIWKETFNGKYADQGSMCPALQVREQRGVSVEHSLTLPFPTNLGSHSELAHEDEASPGSLLSQNAHLEGLLFSFLFFNLTKRINNVYTSLLTKSR